MMQTPRIREKLTGCLPLFLYLLLVLQPLMDILSYWLGQLGRGNALTLALRMGLFALTVLAGFCLSRHKKAYWIGGGLVILLGLGHVYAAWQYGYANPVSDLANYVRVIQMPVTTLCFITFLRENESCYEMLERAMATNLLVIVLSLLLSVLTGTENSTYADGLGCMGWFNNSNSQSAILTVLCSVTCSLFYRRRGLKSPLFWAVLLGSLTLLYLTGTRLSYLGLAALGFGMGLSLVLICRKNWKKACAFFGAAVLFLALLPWSPMMQHQNNYEGTQSQRQGAIDDLLGDYTLPELDLEQMDSDHQAELRTQWIQALTPIYKKYVPDFVEMFGVEKTIEVYNYSWQVKELTATRPRKIKFARLLMEASPASARFFGVELSRFTVGDTIYDVENDLHAIYFLYGAVGFVLMTAFLAYFLILIAIALLKDAKTYFTMDAAGWGIGLVMCLIHAVFTAGVLRRPNASIYLSAALAAVYYLVKIKKYPEAGKRVGEPHAV